MMAFVQKLFNYLQSDTNFHPENFITRFVVKAPNAGRISRTSK